ncbi:carbohydrate-binding protein [Streptomyces bambusae]|uniref:CBM35 domain-containing protein n=1 Tax=Streptomyces bambusae TaxID=1550616 RepID=UPI001CFCEA84|nr:carbohydrate-binding protein [Streptomyces bambusae]MCB5166145.1 carbohydrate-binding protein [Streptomyces bambusae]
MTTPANNGPNNGANTPEDDDPFGYLYADGQAAGATPPTQGGGYGYPGQGGGQPGVPRTSYNQVRTVGERTYGGQRGHVPQQQPHPQPGHQPQPHYQAPEAIQAAGGYGVPPQQTYGGQQSYAPPAQPAPPARGSNRRGLLIGAIAVVGAVVIGIGVALISDQNKDKDKGKDTSSNTPVGQSTGAQPTPGKNDPTKKPVKSSEIPVADAAAGPGIVLSGGATPQNHVPGAKGAGGQYVGGFNQVGAAITWTVDVPETGTYTFLVNYGVPGKDGDGTLTINGERQDRAISLKNFSKAGDGEWEKGWTYSYSYIKLSKGTNALKLSCESNNKCEAIIDQLRLIKGEVKS